MDATVTRPATTRRRDDGRPWNGRACRVNAAHVGEIDELVGAASRLLDRDLRRAESVIADHSSARAVLGTVWDAAVDALLAGDRGAAVAARGSGLVELMNAVRDLDTRLLHEQVRLRDRAFDRVRDSLAALREADTTAALVDLAPATACTLGFDRAIVSRIADSLWIPEKVHVERDAKWADEILEIGRAQPQVLGGALVETEMVRRRVAILVDQVQDRPGVHRPIAEASMSRSYTAAPIVVGGEVAGFVHADCYHQQRDVDETDRLALAMFAEGLGQALSRCRCRRPAHCAPRSPRASSRWARRCCSTTRTERFRRSGGVLSRCGQGTAAREGRPRHPPGRTLDGDAHGRHPRRTRSPPDR